MVERLTGYMPTPALQPDAAPHWRAADLLGAEPTPDEASNLDLLPEHALDQQMSDCVANVVALLLRASLVLGGELAAQLPSRLWLHFLARSQHFAADRNTGTYIPAAFAAARRLGFPPEALWPYRPYERLPAALGRQIERWAAFPSTDAFRVAADRRDRTGLAYYRITEEGDARVQQVRRALASRRLVAFGTTISKAFMAGVDPDRPVDPPGRAEPLGGGHAMLLHGYDARSALALTTWGDGFGDRGRFRLSWDYVVHESTHDLWVVRTAPPAPRPVRPSEAT